MLNLRQIKKTYDQNTILKGIDLEINDGEFIVVLGPSGSGKSTLIRIIAGLETLDSGEIVFDDRNILSLDPKDRELSMVFQNYALYPHKTVYQNIAFPLKLAGEEKKIIDKKVKDIAETLNITELLERKPGQLSGGQRQRVALARAMAKEPKIFLLDEPLSNLDAKLRTKMRKEIYSLHKSSKATFIYVTHDQIEALTLGDRVVILDKGEIQQVATPHQIYNDPANAFVASFIGSPPCNLFEFNGDYLGVRPEYFSLEPGLNDELELKVKLENIELIGSDYLIYFREDIRNQELIAKIPSYEYSDDLYKEFNKTQEELKFSIFVSKNLLYYFNRSSGIRLNRTAC